MPTITNYQVLVPMDGLVDYVSVQYADDFAISMPKEQYEKQLAEQAKQSTPSLAVDAKEL
jgi:hypothetical protein